MEENLSVYSPEIISRVAYEHILERLGAQFAPDPIYDARITRERRHAWFVRYTKLAGEDPHGYLNEDNAQFAAKALGVPPQTAITIRLNREIGASNIAVDFVLLLAEHYPCVVVHEFRETSTPEEFMRAAEPGYDGYRWDTTSNAVVKGPPETLEEQSQRLKQARRDQLFGVVGMSTGGAAFWVYTPAEINLEAFEQLMHEVGANLTHPQAAHASLSHNELKVQVQLLAGEHFRLWWDGLTDQFRSELINRAGEPIQSVIELRAEGPLASINLALDFLFVFEQHYPCLVRDRGGVFHTPADLLEFAQPGYDGYEWNADHTQIVKAQPEPPMEP